MTTALYRKSSNEVLKISVKNQPFSGADATYFGVLTGPVLVDGVDVIDASGDFRVLGFAKIAEPGLGLIRNATQGEIDGFAGAEVSDESAMDAERAQSLADLDPVFRKIFKALLLRIIDEVFAKTNTKVNGVIDQWEQFKANVAAAGNLNDIKASTAALPQIASDLKEVVTLEAAVNALKNDISSGN